MKKTPARTGFVKFESCRVENKAVRVESFRKMTKFNDNFRRLEEMKEKADQGYSGLSADRRPENNSMRVVNSNKVSGEAGFFSLSEIEREFTIENLEEFNCIRNVIEHENVLVCSPQRYRNAIYQTSAKLIRGACVVITQCEPLLNNQYETLRMLNKSCCYLNRSDNITIDCEFIFVNLSLSIDISRTIEKLENFSTISQIGLIVLQDTQLIITYSEDYRTRYKKVSLLRSRFPSAKFLCLSTPLVDHEISCIQDYLGTDFFVSKFGPVVRDVRYKVNEISRLEEATQIIWERYSGRKGVIFLSSSVNEIKALSDALNEMQMGCTLIHSKLDKKDKLKNIESWNNGRFKILIIASLINIDFAIIDVEFVVHYKNLKSIQDCVSEISYCGSANQPLFYHILYDSLRRCSRLSSQDVDKESDFNQVAQFVKSFDECRKVAIFKYFGTDSEACSVCDVCLERSENGDFDLPHKRNRL